MGSVRWTVSSVKGEKESRLSNVKSLCQRRIGEEVQMNGLRIMGGVRDDQKKGANLLIFSGIE